MDAFDCGKPALNDWLTRQAQASGSSKTYVIAEDERIAGYFSLTGGQIDTLEAPDRVRKGMGSYRTSLVTSKRERIRYLISLGRGYESSTPPTFKENGPSPPAQFFFASVAIGRTKVSRLLLNAVKP